MGVGAAFMTFLGRVPVELFLVKYREGGLAFTGRVFLLLCAGHQRSYTFLPAVFMIEFIFLLQLHNFCSLFVVRPLDLVVFLFFILKLYLDHV
jgi:hypothetical protein